MPAFSIKFELPFEIKKENDWYVSSCHILDVHSQGKTKSEAKNNLNEALFLFLLSCFERGTLDEVLKECGFEAIETPIRQKKIKKTPYLDVSIPFGIKQTSALCPA